jgi:precorrin-6Y C5,15-methyltransferase (decarboxylating)
MPLIDVIGLGADGPAGLRPELAERIGRADFLAGGERQLHFFPSIRATRFILKNNLAELLHELQARAGDERCVVLASGDPLFYGIGTYLVERLGSTSVRIEPAVSSMQLAFARAGLPWHAAALASIHGRDHRTVLLPLLGRPTIGLFTEDGDSPAAVARFFLQRGLADYEAIVGENLGAAPEQVSRFANLADLADRHFAPLNYLLLRSTRDPAALALVERKRSLAPGIPDEAFTRPTDGPEMMTRQEVRSVLLGKLRPTEPGDTVWDIGAGLGTVSVEIAILRRDVEVVAVECDAGRAAFVRNNREQFGAYNMRVVEGTAPLALASEVERPRIVFLGGSGAHLTAMLDFVAQAVRPGGRLLANFVTLEHLTLMLQWLRQSGWPFEVTEIRVARSDHLAGLTGLKPQRGVFLVRADKPEAPGE